MPCSVKSKTNTRAVIVAGMRTPFVRAFGPLMKMDTFALSSAAVKALLDKTGLDKKEINGVSWGGVILPGGAPNIAREIVLDLDMPHDIEGTTVTRACTSGLVAITNAVAMIERGEAEVIIAGGSDSTSNAEVKMPQSFVHKTAPVLMSGKSGVGDYLGLLAKISVRKDLLPQRPAIRERTTGELMGEAAEKMVEIWGITREEQDKFAVQSHHRAAAAIRSGRFKEEITPVSIEGKEVHEDNIVRGDTSVEKMAKLKSVFKEGGTLTAANSSALTDGAAAVLIMSEEKAKALGFKPLAAIRSWSYDAVDPADQLLIGPALSIPKALERAELSIGDIDFIDIHEAFAGQVLCVLKALADKEFCKERLGLDAPYAEIDPESINVHGGSVALGHPFAATGPRMVTTMANELAHTGKKTAVLTICAAGGQSAAIVLERVD